MTKAIAKPTRWILLLAVLASGLLAFSGCGGGGYSNTASSTAGVFPSSLGYTQPAGIK